MNDELIDHMIDEMMEKEKGSTARASAIAALDHSEEARLIGSLAELADVDWPDDAVGDRLIQHLIDRSDRRTDLWARAPGRRRARAGPDRHGRRGTAAVLVAALVVALVVVSLVWSASSPGPGRTPPGVATRGPVHLHMKLVNAVSSPFQSVGADPGAFYLQCITDSTCYGTSGSFPAGGSPALYRTDDGGATWVATAALPDGLAAPLACTSATDCMAAVTETPGPGDSVPNSLPIATTTDAGAHWSRSSLVLPGPLQGAQITEVACGTADRCVVSVDVETFPSGAAQPSDGTLFTTSDAGVTWTQDAETPDTVVHNGLFTMRCASDGTCLGVTFVGSAGQSGAIGTVRSTDFGASWSAVSSSRITFGGGEVFAACGDTTHCMMVGPSDSGTSVVLAATADGGTTWRVSPAPSGWANEALSLSCATGTDCDVSTAHASSSGYAKPVIEATTDLGVTWTALGLPEVGGSQLGSVQPLSCPSVTGCIGVGVLPDQTTSVLVSSLPLAG